MKTLIVIVHPNLKDSKVNRAWIKEAERYPKMVFEDQIAKIEEALKEKGLIKG